MTQTENGQKRRWSYNPQNIAWLVLITSFVLFCVLCAAGTFGAYWFFFESPTPINVRLTVSRGAVTVILPGGTSSVMNNPGENPYPIPLNSTLQITDSISQGYLTFEDGYSRQNLVTVFLLPNSTFRLDEATRPRFEWSQRGYVVRLGNLSGHFAVDIMDGLNRPIVLNMQGPVGAVHLSDSGSYRLDAVEQFTRLYSGSGRGLIELKGRAWQVNPGYQAVLGQDQPEPSIVPNPFEDLIVQNIRSAESPAVTTNSLGEPNVDKDKSMPLGWGCTNQAAVDRNEPEGYWQRARLDGLIVLQMARGGPTEKLISHAETGCEFYFTQNRRGTVGQDLTAYKALTIRLKMKIEFQDVYTCGFQGSECPVMLEIEYVPADSKDGSTQVWRQGFYAIRPSFDSSVRTCDTCPHDHEQISPNAWYIYDSGDLLNQFPEAKRPVSLVKVRVYASGHQFNAALAEIAVLGEK